MAGRVLVSWCCLLATVVAAEPVSWSASVEPTTVKAGESFTLRLTARIAGGYHIYAAAQTGDPVATSFSLATSAQVQRAGGLREPAPKRKADEAFGIDVLYHEGTVTLRQPLKLAASAPPGGIEVKGTVRYQACTENSCLPPEDAAVSAKLTVAAPAPGKVKSPSKPPPKAAVKAEPKPPPRAEVKAQAKTEVKAEPTAKVTPRTPSAATPPAGNTAAQARARGLGAFLLVAFLAGFAALLTPCVFPMVPITVSFFTKQAGDSPRRRVSLALSYGLGIVVMYTGLGLVLAMVGGAAGAQRVATNPWVNLFFAALFVFFALSLFGYFELQLPSGLVNRSSRLGSAGGYLGAWFMGLTLTLAAFTCTVQFVGGVLVWAANGERLWPILGMLAFSSAFALPFVLLALFPQYLAAMPRSGGWLHHTKVLLGFIEVGAALKFVSNADLVWQWRVLSRELVLALWAATAFLCVVYLLGRLRLGDGDTPDRVGRGRRLLAALFGALCAYLSWGLTGARLETNLESLLPPAGYGRGPQEGGDGAWIDDYDQGLATARRMGRVAFVDFSGVTCTNCRWMEQNMFPRPEVAKRLQRFVLIRVHTDLGPQAERYRQMQIARYQTASLPYYALVKPDGSTVATFDGMTRDEARFVAFLDRATGR